MTGSGNAAGAPLRLLAVEDSRADARLLQEFLRPAIDKGEVALDFAATLGEAEERVRAAAYDCVLLDLGLPDASGFDNAARIRAANPRQAVVIMTGLDSEEAALGHLQHGAQDYLVKGRHDGATIIRLVRRAIERNRVLSEVDRMREEQYRLATHDPLTGLPNRQLFDDRARCLLAQASRNAGGFAVAYLDLDGLKAVNDRHGHAAGDALLRRVARVLHDAVRATDTVARVGGDEFLLLLAPLADAEKAAKVIARVRERIAAIGDVDGKPARISASAGVALYPKDARTLEQLVLLADQAMYRAKRAAKGA